MPKIALDISPTIDGNAVRGMGYYVKNLISALKSEIKTNPDFENWQIELISQKQSLSGFDLVHFPYFDPFKLTLPAKKSIPTIVTVADLIPRQFKKHFPVGIRGEIKWLIQKCNLKKADYIITISHYSKHVIKDIINYPEDKIFVTWLAADKNYHSEYPSAYLQKIKKKYNLPQKFVLNNGDINWSKNIPNLVRACLDLKYPFVIVGSASTARVPDHPWTQDILWLQQQKSPLIHRLGFVPDQDLPAIYKLATIHCQPSFAEGFGLSVIKSMQVGVPVAYSQETSLPEIMNFSGEYFNPYSLTSIETALKKLWTDSPLRQKYIQKGLKQAKIFNWQHTALQTLAVYKLAISDER